MKGITFSLQKNDLAKTQAAEEEVDDSIETVRIKKIDVIYNYEYEELSTKYTLPVFFRSTPSRNTTFMQQGFIDNGRQTT